MKLRAQLTIDIDAEDYIEAAEHQRKLASLFQVVKADYGAANFNFRQRRDAPVERFARKAPASGARGTGALSVYEDG